jgi:hypothetical protein
MMNLKATSEVKCCIIDTGCFVHVARRLGREFAKTYYWTPWETSFAHFRDAIIGDGYEEIIRLESIESVIDECDLFVFLDIGYSDLQKRLVKMGKAVWGCRDADELEARRGKFLQVLEQQTDLPVPKFEKIKGLTNLRLHLKDHPDRYIKVSTYRGDFETCHFRSMDEDECLIDKWAVMLGPLKEHFNFFVYEPIKTEIEDGIDTYCVDGQWPETVIHGMECKDAAYIGTFQKFADVPEEVRCVNEAFSPILASYGYRGMFCTEVRITKEGESYFIDPTCRFPSPPSQIICEMYGNLGDIVWQGANGILVEPEQVAQFAAQAIFHIDRDEWGVFPIPEELDPWVKIGFSCRIDGNVCVSPDPTGVAEIGWVIGIGDTMEEAIEHLRENKDKMPEGVHVKFECLAELLKEIHTANEKGMEFTDQPVPEPASIIEE